MAAMRFCTWVVLLGGVCTARAASDTVEQTAVLSHRNGSHQLTLTSPDPEKTILVTLDVFYVPNTGCGAYFPSTVVGKLDGHDGTSYSSTVPQQGKPGALWDVGLNTTGVVGLALTTSAICMEVRVVAEFIGFDGPLEETQHRVQGALGLMRVPLVPDRFVVQVSMEPLQVQRCPNATQRATTLRVDRHVVSTIWDAEVGVARVLDLGMTGFTGEDVVVSVLEQGAGYHIVSANGTTRVIPDGDTCWGEMLFTVASYPVTLPVRTVAPTPAPATLVPTTASPPGSDDDSSTTVVIVLVTVGAVLLVAAAVAAVCWRHRTASASFRDAEMGPTATPMQGV
eukprot:TRINITY_DN788_c0_g1_i4.p1 TRINITY_DN788_c0_g1~~TRINITY_DN788_c0_g1_i4.p1  ORF type:complete len:339 (+),score=132.62 TRINITY_DN788_c0_g1_i4:73-1089(+)